MRVYTLKNWFNVSDSDDLNRISPNDLFACFKSPEAEVAFNIINFLRDPRKKSRVDGEYAGAPWNKFFYAEDIFKSPVFLRPFIEKGLLRFYRGKTVLLVTPKFVDILRKGGVLYSVQKNKLINFF